MEQVNAMQMVNAGMSGKLKMARLGFLWQTLLSDKDSGFLQSHKTTVYR